MPDEFDEKKVFLAFGNPKFKWRTIDGIANEAKVPPDTVRVIVNEKTEQIVKSSVPNAKGEPVFMLREKRRLQTSAFLRLISALKNRGD